MPQASAVNSFWCEMAIQHHGWCEMAIIIIAVPGD